MATLELNSQLQSLVSEYGVFWQLWPQFYPTNGECRPAGFEVELIGSHPSDFNHLDPACPKCWNVRTVLLMIADLLPSEVRPDDKCLMYSVDSHSNSILRLPALGNRSAVSVSVYVSWSRSDGQSFETHLLSEIKTLLSRLGIHQR